MLLEKHTGSVQRTGNFVCSFIKSQKLLHPHLYINYTKMNIHPSYKLRFFFPQPIFWMTFLFLRSEARKKHVAVTNLKFLHYTYCLNNNAEELGRTWSVIHDNSSEYFMTDIPFTLSENFAATIIHSAGTLFYPRLPSLISRWRA